MTREHKLAMVVGFGLLLFVGILVSDHFSTAQRQVIPNLAIQDQTRVRVTPPISIAAVPFAGASAAQTKEIMVTAAAQDVRTTSNEQQLTKEITNSKPNIEQDTVLAVIAKANTGKIQEGQPGIKLHPVMEGETLYSICAKTYGDGSLWKELAEFNKKALPNATKLRKGVTLQIPPVEQLRHGAVLASTTKGARVSVTPHEQENIGPRGAANLNISPEIPLLAAADISSIDMQPKMIGAPIEVVEVDAVKNKSLGKNAVIKVSTNENNSSLNGDIYVVQKGDTLGSIAKKKLGKSSKWKEIASANVSTLSDSTALSPGMSLRLPNTN